ncbi:hypothetical protein D3C75_758720 [compost metagenome]
MGGIVDGVDADAVVAGGIHGFKLVNLAVNRAARIHRKRIAAVAAGHIAADVRIIHQHHGVVAFAGGDIPVHIGAVLQGNGGVAAVLAGIHVAINGAVIHQHGIGGIAVQRHVAVHHAMVGERQVGLAFLIDNADIAGHGAVIQRQRVLGSAVHRHRHVAKGIDVNVLERLVVAQLFDHGIQVLRHQAVGCIHAGIGQGN